MSEPTVRAARRDDMRALAAVVSRALASDPFVGWLVGTHDGVERRRALYVDLMLRRVCLALDAVTTTDERDGAAAWVPPSAQPLPFGMRLAILPAMIRFVGLGRLSAVSAATATIELERPRAPHWHLALLGVEPERQRRGIGLALLGPMLARCDETRLVAHAETTHEENVSFYERAGFRVVRELPRDEHGRPRMWILQRPAG